MRLRLSIYRNELPAVNALWPVSNTELKCTISQLLEQVNAIFPLESGTWGLESYVVTVGGYECLHYHCIGEVCRDEDELVIRPLQYSEVRTRTVLGRDQIASDGRHLYDGLPFGRPKLKGVVRPDVRIPPMKKVKLDLEGTAAEISAVDGGTLMQIEGMDMESSREEEDVDYEPERSESELSSGTSSSEEDDTSSDDVDDSNDSGMSNSSSSEEDETDMSSSDEPWNGCHRKSPKKQDKKSAQPDPQIDVTTNVPLGFRKVAVKPKASMEEGECITEQHPTKPPKVFVPPGEGLAVTKQRNNRRRDSRRLAHLKRIGVLPQNANLETLREWKKSVEYQSSSLQDPLIAEVKEPGLIAERLGPPEKQMSPVGQAISAEMQESPPQENGHEPGMIEIEQRNAENERKTAERDIKAKSRASHLEEQRQHLLDQIKSGGIDVTANKCRKHKISDLDSESEVEAPDEISSKPSTFLNNVELLRPSDGNKVASMDPPVTRRAKLDSDGSNRMIFNSLGLRVPKTKAEKDALQKKLSDQPTQGHPSASKKLKSQENVTHPTDSFEAIKDDDDDMSWRDKLCLTAVECCDENITLSQPPFPFHQRWDPQQRQKRKNGRKSANSDIPGKKLLKRRGGDVVCGNYFEENYDKYNTNGSGDALEYDEVDDADDDEYWEDGALLDNEYDDDSADLQLMDSDAKQAREADDEFPPLPNDISDLQILAEDDARVNDFITYQELTCSAATDWTPMMRARTALLLGRDDEMWTIKLALRDLPTKEYDEEGRRVYSKFEMEGLSDDEGEEGGRIKTVKWNDLLEPRLLKRVSDVL